MRVYIHAYENEDANEMPRDELHRFWLVTTTARCLVNHLVSWCDHHDDHGRWGSAEAWRGYGQSGPMVKSNVPSINPNPCLAQP
jgi:hypothetical protein